MVADKSEKKGSFVAYLHQVPAVDMSILRAAQDVCVLTGQTAVQLVALHLVAGIPAKTNTNIYVYMLFTSNVK